MGEGRGYEDFYKRQIRVTNDAGSCDLRYRGTG